MAELSSEEFRRNLFQTFRSRGVLEALKTQLRNRLIAELQETAGQSGFEQQNHSSAVTDNLCELVANSLVADHLKRSKYEYSLSVFLPESGLHESKLLSVKDMLLILKITTDSQLHKHLEILIGKERSSKGFLTELLTQLVSLHNHEKSSKAVQTFLPGGQSSLEDKLESVENQYTRNLQNENKSWSIQMENRFLELNRQWEQKKKKILDKEVEYVKATEIARVKLEEKDKYQKEIQKIRHQFEKEFAAKSEKLRAGEKEKFQLLGHQKQIQDEEAFSQRQKLLEGMLALKERESEFDLNQQMRLKSLQLEEERIKVLSQECKHKKGLLEGAETNYHNRLQEEVKRYKRECEEEMFQRRQNLERKENQIQRDRDTFEKQRDAYMNASSELQRTKERLRELQLQLENNKVTVSSVLQQKEAAIQKLTEDCEAVQERELNRSRENAALKRDLLKFQEEKKGHEKVIQELTEKSIESATDLQRLREELRQTNKNSKSKEKTWKDLKKELESKLDDERQKTQKYQHLYEKLHASHSAREQEVADLKFTLQQTQQVLDIELDRRRANSVPRIESVSSDVELPVVKQGPQQARPRLATDTDSNTDETSSTMVMIAQSKALFDRLETEAKTRDDDSSSPPILAISAVRKVLAEVSYLVVCISWSFHGCRICCLRQPWKYYETTNSEKELEESYHRFQSRINQMELDVLPAVRAVEAEQPPLQQLP